MSVSPTVLVVTFVIGVPLMLLALGVLYHAYLFSQQPPPSLEEHVDSLATESADELLFALQEAVDEMQAQLAHQRETLAGMLSDRPQPAFATVAPLSLDAHPDPIEERPAAGEFIPQRPEARSAASPVSSLASLSSLASTPVMTSMPASLAGAGNVRTQIARLAEQGMSDRAIARELHIGLEEVRIARMLGRHS